MKRKSSESLAPPTPLRHCLWLLLLASTAHCGGGQKEGAPTRSPSHDYGREPPRSADGQVIGADGRDPADTLRMGPTTGSEGTKPAPGWERDKDGKLRRNPEQSSPGHDHSHDEDHDENHNEAGEHDDPKGHSGEAHSKEADKD